MFHGLEHINAEHQMNLKESSYLAFGPSTGVRRWIFYAARVTDVE